MTDEGPTAEAPTDDPPDTRDLRVVDPDDAPTDRATSGPPRSDPVVHGVLLAAGTSSRYGDANKLLATLEGAVNDRTGDADPIVRHAARSLSDARVDGVTVVVGHQAERVRAALADLDVGVVKNADYDRGQASSVRAGVEAAREAGADAVLIALGDMPRVETGTIERLIEAYERGAGTALAAAYRGRRGNPVLFDRRHFDALADLTGDTGGRDVLLSAERAALVETGDPGVRDDVDRPEDSVERN